MPRCLSLSQVSLAVQQTEVVVPRSPESPESLRVGFTSNHSSACAFPDTPLPSGSERSCRVLKGRLPTEGLPPSVDGSLHAKGSLLTAPRRARPVGHVPAVRHGGGGSTGRSRPHRCPAAFLSPSVFFVFLTEFQAILNPKQSTGQQTLAGRNLNSIFFSSNVHFDWDLQNFATFMKYECGQPLACCGFRPAFSQGSASAPWTAPLAGSPCWRTPAPPSPFFGESAPRRSPRATRRPPACKSTSGHRTARCWERVWGEGGGCDTVFDDGCSCCLPLIKTLASGQI